MLFRSRKMTQQTPELPPIKLAFVLEGEVVDVLYTDERLSAIFTSSPTVIDVTDLINNDKDSVKVGFKYDSETNMFKEEE